MAFTAENIGATHVLDDLKLSPDGSRLVYRVGIAHRIGDHDTASLWYSPDVTKMDSAKQLTSGLYNDGNPAWHPNSEKSTLYFLSDRHNQGGPKQMYTYSLDGPGEPKLIHDGFKEKKRPIQQFHISPDGRYIAFCSADEPSAEDERKAAQKDDVRVWDERMGNARLRIYTISTGEIRTLVEDKKHVASCTWSPDSKELLYLLCDRPDAEARFGKNSLFVISILASPSGAAARHLTNFENGAMSDAIWPSPSRRFFFNLHPYLPHNANDALAVYRHSLDQISVAYSEEHCFYLGETEDPFSLISLNSEGGEFAVGVAADMDTRVDIVNHDGVIFTLFKTTKREAVELFDVKKVGNDYVMACIRSSGPYKEPPNVWVGKTNNAQSLTPTTKLSSHFSWTANTKLGNVETFEWEGEDGVALNGMAWFPQGIDPTNLKRPLPTILHIHGGPYLRETPELWPFHLGWQPTLAEQGYLVLSPNYRGSSGRGHAFGRIAPPAIISEIGWSDVNTMVDEAVMRGLADKEKLAIGGWSMGGYLAAWGVSQTKNKFRCGIMGAGVADWGSWAIENDIPDAGAEIGGTTLWSGIPLGLAGDPIKHVKDIETAMLVVHGERDTRVPVTQGVGFHRGLRRMSKYPDRHCLLVYPREGHFFTERKHVEDLIKRVIGHYEAWLK